MISGGRGSMRQKLYSKNRNPEELEPQFFDHMMAMTGENLHGKREIAMELAYRDKRIAELEAELIECGPTDDDMAPDRLDSWYNSRGLKRAILGS
jgi:hypothetical protein